MTPEKKDRLQKLSTLLGAFVTLFPTGIVYLYGNLSVYLYSYQHSKSNNNNDKIDTPWLTAIYTTSFCSGMLAAAFLEKHVGRRVTISLGMLLFNVGIFSSFFALRVDISLMNFTLGLVAGLGYGLTNCMVLNFVVDCYGASKSGLGFSSVLGASPLGSIASNQIITQYINPNNLKPNEVVGPTRYFDQRDIITRVPRVFLFYGIVSSCLFVLGFCLMRKKATTNDYKINKDIENSITSMKEWPEERRKLLNKIPEQNSNKEYMTGSPDIKDKQKGQYDSKRESKSLLQENDDNTIRVSTTRNSSQDLRPKDKSDIDHGMMNEPRSLSAKEMLKTKSFYCMWFTLLTVEVALFIATNYYKLFGQSWIHDDHFLTDVGTASGMFVFILRVLSGIVIDQIGFKLTMIGCLSVNSIAFSLYYLTTGLNQWLYLIGTILIYSISACLRACFPAGVAKAFGKEHFSLNISIVGTAQIVVSVLIPPIIQLLLSHFGWFAIFFFAAALNFLGLLLTMVLLKEC